MPVPDFGSIPYSPLPVTDDYKASDWNELLSEHYRQVQKNMSGMLLKEFP